MFPDIAQKQMADIYNEIPRNGRDLKQATNGILCPLPKPGKKMYSVEILQPIMKLSNKAASCHDVTCLMT